MSNSIQVPVLSGVNLGGLLEVLVMSKTEHDVH